MAHIYQELANTAVCVTASDKNSNRASLTLLSVGGYGLSGFATLYVATTSALFLSINVSS
jgi:hypothetical protein